jgi:hypothetical protein
MPVVVQQRIRRKRAIQKMGAAVGIEDSRGAIRCGASQ